MDIMRGIRILAVFIVSSISLPAMAQDPGAMPDPAAMPESGALVETTAPADSAESAGRVADIAFTNIPIPIVIQQIKSDLGDTVILRGQAVSQLMVTIIMESATTEEVLDYLANTYNLTWIQRPDGSYELMDQETYRTTVLPEQVRRKVFRPQYRPAQEVYDLFQQMATPNLGQVALDPTTGKIIVTDLLERIAAMQELMEEIDIPLVTRVFDVRYANVEEVAEALGELTTEGVGDVRLDSRTRQIIARDQFKAIKQMELLVMTLDKAPEVRAYDANRVGIDGEMFEQLVEKILTIVTAEENVQYDPLEGRILVEDIPEVHERIERLFRVFDQPQRQIHLMAEIVEADLDRTFAFTSELEVAGNLNQAIDLGLTSLFSPGTGTEFNFANLEDALPVARVGSGGIFVGNVGENYAAQLSTLLTDSDTKVLLKPRLLVLNQMEATIHVGRNEPVPIVFINDSNLNNSYQQSSQQTVTTGLEVTFIPAITSGGLVELEVELSNEEPFRVPVRNAQGNVQDLLGTTEQSVTTRLLIPSGETRVISGLNRKVDNETKSGVPILRQIPVVGPLFGSYSKTQQDRSLLFFLTPIIVEEKPSEKFLRDSQKPYADLATTQPVVEEVVVSEPVMVPLEGKDGGYAVVEGNVAGERLVFEGETGPFASIGEEAGPEVILSPEPPEFREDEQPSIIRSGGRGVGPGPSGTITPSGASSRVIRGDGAGTPAVTPAPIPEPAGGSEGGQVQPTPAPTPQPTTEFDSTPILTPEPVG